MRFILVLQEFHRSVEASYAQARSCAQHLAYGLRASQAREKQARSRLRELDAQVAESRTALRNVRRDIVQRVLASGEAFQPGTLAGKAEVEKLRAKREDEVETDARAKLRGILTECAEVGRTADAPVDDGDLPGWDQLYA